MDLQMRLVWLSKQRLVAIIISTLVQNPTNIYHCWASADVWPLLLIEDLIKVATRRNRNNKEEKKVSNKNNNNNIKENHFLSQSKPQQAPPFIWSRMMIEEAAIKISLAVAVHLFVGQSRLASQPALGAPDVGVWLLCDEHNYCY